MSDKQNFVLSTSMFIVSGQLPSQSCIWYTLRILLMFRTISHSLFDPSMFFYPNVIGHYPFRAEVSFQKSRAMLVHLLQDAIDANVLTLVVNHVLVSSAWSSNFPFLLTHVFFR